MQAEPVGLLLIPAHVVHRESNSSNVEQTLVIVGTGECPVTVDVDRPPDNDKDFR